IRCKRAGLSLTNSCMRPPVAHRAFDAAGASRYILGTMSTLLPLKTGSMTGLIPHIVIVGFVAGAIGVLLFHQGVILAMYLVGLAPPPPYSRRGPEPFGVPQVLSWAFWGGLWGIVLVWCMVALRGADRLWLAVLFGGVLPTLVGIFVVSPLKGGDPMENLQLARLLHGFVINGAWGLGTALIYRIAARMLP